MVRRRHNPYVNIVLATIVFLLTVKGVGAWYDHWLQSPSDPDDQTEVILDIVSGDRGQSVAEKLEDQGLISSDWAFRWYLRASDQDGSIQAGRFSLSPSMSPFEIAETITSGTGQMTLTIPEGWTIEEIDDELTELELISEGEFSQCAQSCPIQEEWTFLENASSLEGYLFPDTYFIDPASFDPESFIHTLVGTFEQKFLTPENQALITTSGRTLDEIVIMASIVEREAMYDEERPVIAGILWKRLDNGWGLEADATLLYVLGDVTLNSSNLDTESPYNTRLYRGLTPTAISNPGLVSLESSLLPEESSYWYYLHDQETGEAHYAATNDEHNANKAKWLY